MARKWCSFTRDINTGITIRSSRSRRPSSASSGVGYPPAARAPRESAEVIGRMGASREPSGAPIKTHDERRLLPGTGFTIEPGVYFERYGVRTEINVVWGESGPEVTGPRQQEIVALI